MFGELEWSVPDVDYEPSVEHIEDMLKTLEEQEAKFKANHNPKYESELDELFEEFAVDRTNSLPASLAQIYDPRIAKLYPRKVAMAVYLGILWQFSRTCSPLRQVLVRPIWRLPGWRWQLAEGENND